MENSGRLLEKKLKSFSNNDSIQRLIIIMNLSNLQQVIVQSYRKEYHLNYLFKFEQILMVIQLIRGQSDNRYFSSRRLRSENKFQNLEAKKSALL